MASPMPEVEPVTRATLPLSMAWFLVLPRQHATNGPFAGAH
jgi:hypothetical protein